VPVRFSEVEPYAEIRRDASSRMSFSGWTKTCADPAPAPPLLTFGGNNLGPMGEMNEVFAAQDDETALAMLEGGGWGSPSYGDEGLRAQDLAELEMLLTGQASQEVAADPRHGLHIAELFDEGVGVAEAGLWTVTDTLTRALAAADSAALSAAAVAWGNRESAVRELAAVARYAAAHGHRMYCFWHF
jgi:hypothetical protein